MFTRHKLGESDLVVNNNGSVIKFRLNLVEEDIDNFDFDALQALVVQYYPAFTTFSSQIREMLIDSLFNGNLIQF